MNFSNNIFHYAAKLLSWYSDNMPVGSFNSMWLDVTISYEVLSELEDTHYLIFDSIVTAIGPGKDSCTVYLDYDIIRNYSIDCDPVDTRYGPIKTRFWVFDKESTGIDLALKVRFLEDSKYINHWQSKCN